MRIHLVGLSLVFLVSNSVYANPRLCDAIGNRNQDLAVAEIKKINQRRPGSTELDAWCSKYRGERPLTLAIRNNLLRVVKFLVRSGANKELTNENDETPLLLALELRKTEFAIFLLKKGARKDIGPHRRINILDLAVSIGSSELIEAILDEGEPWPAADERIREGLVSAIEEERHDLANLLILRGARIPHEDRHLLSRPEPFQLHQGVIESYLNSLGTPEDRIEAVGTYVSFLRDARLEETALFRQLWNELRDHKEKQLLQMHAVHTEVEPGKACLDCEDLVIRKIEQRSGPANCDCFICQGCIPKWVDYALRNHQHQLITCPGCREEATESYLQKNGVSFPTMARFKKLQWKAKIREANPQFEFCPNEECINGKVMEPDDSPIFNCELCNWHGCLKCHLPHVDSDCKQAQEDAEFLKMIFREGAKPAPAERIMDPKDPRFYQGRFRPCYHCGVKTEKNGGCNHMRCSVCRKDWDWNLGKYNGTTSEGNQAQQYEPLKAPH